MCLPDMGSTIFVFESTVYLNILFICNCILCLRIQSIAFKYFLKVFDIFKYFQNTFFQIHCQYQHFCFMITCKLMFFIANHLSANKLFSTFKIHIDYNFNVSFTQHLAKKLYIFYRIFYRIFAYRKL